MKGSVRTRGPTWTCQFSISTGEHRRHVTKGGFRTRRECERAVRECERALRDAMALSGPGGPAGQSR